MSACSCTGACNLAPSCCNCGWKSSVRFVPYSPHRYVPQPWKTLAGTFQEVDTASRCPATVIEQYEKRLIMEFD